MKAYIKPESLVIALMENKALLSMSFTADKGSDDNTYEVWSRRRQEGWNSSDWSKSGTTEVEE